MQQVQSRRPKRRPQPRGQPNRSRKVLISSRVVFTKAVCASGARSSINNSIVIGKKYLIKSAMASIGPGGRQGKIMNLELELATDESEEDARTARDRSSEVRMEGKKIAKVPAKAKPKPKKPAATVTVDSAPPSCKKSPKPLVQRAVFDSLFKHTHLHPTPAAAPREPELHTLPARPPFVNTASSQADWAAHRLAEDDTCHTNLHASQHPNKEPSTSMQQEVLSGKPGPGLRMPMIVEVSIANSAAGTEDRTAAQLGEMLEDLATKLSLSRTDTHSRSAALQELSEFVYKCENAQIDADVITSTKLGRYLQLMYLMILEFGSSDSPEYDHLIPRTSKLIGKYKRIVTEQVAAPDAVPARRQAFDRAPAAGVQPGRPDVGQELEPVVCVSEGGVPAERACASGGRGERGAGVESDLADRGGLLQRAGPAASSLDGQRRRRLDARQPAEEGDPQDLPAAPRRPARRACRRARRVHEDRAVREQDIPVDRLCH